VHTYAQARSSVLSRSRSVDLREGHEKERLLLLGDPDPGVDDFVFQDRLVLCTLDRGGEVYRAADGDSALAGELQTVRDDVDEDLAKSRGIRDDDVGDVFFDDVTQLRGKNMNRAVSCRMKFEEERFEEERRKVYQDAILLRLQTDRQTERDQARSAQALVYQSNAVHPPSFAAARPNLRSIPQSRT
jgi:hypothetical protein